MGFNFAYPDSLRVAVATYDFSKQGGAIGSIGLGLRVPLGAVVMHANLDVITPATSAGSATIALTLEGAGDIQSAAAFDGAPYHTAGVAAVSGPTWQTGAVKTTAERQLTATIAAAALTAGKFNVHVWYVKAPA